MPPIRRPNGDRREMDIQLDASSANVAGGRFDEARRRGAQLLVRPSVLISPSADGYLAYDLETEALIHLNPIASLLIELRDGTKDVAGLRDVVLPVLGEPRLDRLLYVAHSRPTVAGETFRACAVSCRERPPKTRGSPTWHFRRSWPVMCRPRPATKIDPVMAFRTG